MQQEWQSLRIRYALIQDLTESMPDRLEAVSNIVTLGQIIEIFLI